MVNRAKAIAIRKEGTSWALRNNGRWAGVDLINEVNQLLTHGDVLPLQEVF